jgi:aerobic-type carbon monoxide dehydrogenase small subunit (CoxS/CutS family)
MKCGLIYLVSSTTESTPEESSPAGEIVASVAKTRLSRRTFIKAGAAGAAAAGLAVAVLESQSLVGAQTEQVTSTSISEVAAPYDPFAPITVSMTVNGTQYTASVEPRAMLVNVLRDNFDLTGTKRPCNRQECGGCTVLVDGIPRYSCTYLASRASGHSVLTVEGGVGPNADPVLAAVQAAWVPNDASQCGFCQEGRIMAATALLKSNSSPTEAQVKAGLEGVLCRCGTYVNVLAAMQTAAQSLNGGSSS